MSRLRFDAIPETAIQDCKKFALDTIGVALGASTTEHGKIAADFARAFAEKQESTVIGYGHRTSCLNAAFANGVMAHGIDFDDDYEPGAVHVGCSVIPAALAVGEAHKISGRELLTAVVAGYDISCRVAASFPQGDVRSGFHFTAVANGFGAAAAAGKILNLREAKLVNSFGIAGDQASGLLQYHFDGTMSKHFHGGKAAHNGVLSALLAQGGFTGSPEIFEGDYGFHKVLFRTDYDLAALTRGLGEEFSVSKTSFKPYPSCRSTHSPIQAAVTLKRRHDLQADAIERVILRLWTRAFRSYNKPSPQTGLQALLSEQYNVATALIRGGVVLDDFSPESLKDTRVRELMKKIELVEDSNLTKMFNEKRNRPIELQVVMKSGATYTERVEYPLGSPQNPMSDAELHSKFYGLASSVLSRITAEKLADLIMKLEGIDDVGKIAESLH